MKAGYKVLAYAVLASSLFIGYYIAENSKSVGDFKGSTRILWNKLFSQPALSDFAYMSDINAREALAFFQSIDRKDQLVDCTLHQVRSPSLPDRIIDVGPRRSTLSCNAKDRQLSISFVQTSTGPKCYWIHFYRSGQPQLDIGGQ